MKTLYPAACIADLLGERARALGIRCECEKCRAERSREPEVESRKQEPDFKKLAAGDRDE
jgi:hypothetical protein